MFADLAGADPGIFDKECPNFTQYVETVVRLINSTPRQFSVIEHYIPSLHLLRSFDFNWLKEQMFLQTPGTAQCE